MKKLQAVILAAGKGTRMQSTVPKPLIPVNGEPMLTTVLRTLSMSEVAVDPVLVVGVWTDAIQQHYGDRYIYAVQQEINGTGGAVEAALPCLDTTETGTPVVILYADTPFISVESLQVLRDRVANSTAVLTMYTVTVDDFSNWREAFIAFGRVVRDMSGRVDQIVEYKVASDDIRAIREVNPAVYCVKASWLAIALSRITPNPISGERYLTDLVALARQDGYEIDTIPLPAKESLGLNSLADIENAMKAV
ncbi:MAG: putative udp-n-acetylglucosamine pyrophosphorylase [Candidatus Parcubacteria bacterium]|jgi:bifunctional UDP-N-acetylglucosamine pyrophosphorylase/glucosamine-1-phosphate N-acetyltransferase